MAPTDRAKHDKRIHGDEFLVIGSLASTAPTGQ
jgi:hypothetical protein